jgi:BolA-like protein 3
MSYTAMGVGVIKLIDDWLRYFDRQFSINSPSTMAFVMKTLQQSIIRGVRSPKVTTTSRLFSTREEAMRQSLVSSLEATHCVVEDVSGGCGSMYKLEIESKQFKGLSLVKQHKLVTSILKKEIGDMHGLTIKTKVPQE